MAVVRHLRNGPRVRDFGKIGVLMGGPSTERKISLRSGTAVVEALLQRGVRALPVDIATDSLQENMRFLKGQRLDCAFIALHGHFGEDGQIQGILEQMDIPYTGSEVLASRLAMDKIASRQIFESAGLLVPRYRVINKSSYRNGWMDRFDFDFPLVVKPAAHGSSIGLSLPAGRSALQGSLKNAFCFDERVLVEEYVKGREMTVGILAHNALPVIEIIPKKIFFDYQAKYQPGFTEYIVPARIPSRIAHALQQAAFHAHTLLGCQGCSRVDMILDQDNRPVILEVNTIPGMTSTSLLPKAARAQGVDFPSLCVRLLELAYEKKKSFSAF